jgi:hypothetical protein
MIGEFVVKLSGIGSILDSQRARRRCRRWRGRGQASRGIGRAR